MKRGAMLALGAAALAAGAAEASETVTYTYDALGRLVAVQHGGTVNNGRADSLCYDPAGNRTQYRSSAAGGLADCAAPPPPPPPGNQPPVAAADSGAQNRCLGRHFDVLANDYDPDGHTPLALAGATGGSGLGTAWADQNQVYFDPAGLTGTAIVTYTVRDSLGATTQGILTVTLTGAACAPQSAPGAPAPPVGGQQ